MLALAASLLLASATVSPRAERALAGQLSSKEDVAVVKARVVKGACAVVVLDVDAAAVGKGDNVVAARGRGKDARGRACAVNVVVDVAWRKASPALAAGTAIGFRSVVGAVEVEGNGVVVPCGAADRDAGFVCVRVGNGNVKGVVEAGVVVVVP